MGINDSDDSVLPSDSVDNDILLDLAQTLFHIADDEWNRRRNNHSPYIPVDSDMEMDVDEKEDKLLFESIISYMENLSDVEFHKEYTDLAQSFLLAFDRKMAEADDDLIGAKGVIPGFDPEKVAANTDDTKRVGLFSLPWMSPAMPSVQLATLKSALSADGIESDVHEMYVDYAADIGLNLFNYLGNLLGYLPEWIFSRHYFGPEMGDDLQEMIDQRPLHGIPYPKYSETILKALNPVTNAFLDRMVESVDWSTHDVIGCSLTISQLGSSIAFVRRVKLLHPQIKVVFGGSQCAGPMGVAILKMCPYVDIVAHGEGEIIMPELVRELRSGQDLKKLPGISYRSESGEIITNEKSELYKPNGRKLALTYDSYFERITSLGLINKMSPWVPFESSRGCWYGEKVQCTFCGLHEIMEYRAWDANKVIDELTHLEKRYGVKRFYSMDLIFPLEYLKSFLPRVIKENRDWMFFYEIKANHRRKELEMMADAGILWIQPGIESLDKGLLKLMKKGVSPLQNILLLKWCEELGIYSGWNLLYGLPGEEQVSYDQMTELIPKLTHFRSPSGGGTFQLHRFSPYFDDPESYNISWKGAYSMFKYAFPIPSEDLDQLVYLHDFEYIDDARPADTSKLEKVVSTWRQDYENGAKLQLEIQSDGSSTIVDTREISTVSRHVLSKPETTLYRFLDAGRRKDGLEKLFTKEHPETAKMLESNGGSAAIVNKWIEHSLVLHIDKKIVSLALDIIREPKDEILKTDREVVESNRLQS